MMTVTHETRCQSLLYKLDIVVFWTAAAAVVLSCLFALLRVETILCLGDSIVASANLHTIDMPSGPHPTIVLDPARAHRHGFLAFPGGLHEIDNWVLSSVVRAVAERNVFVLLCCTHGAMGTVWAGLTVLVGPLRQRSLGDLVVRGALAVSIAGLALLSYVVGTAKPKAGYVCGGVTNVLYAEPVGTFYLVVGLGASLVLLVLLVIPAALTRVAEPSAMSGPS